MACGRTGLQSSARAAVRYKTTLQLHAALERDLMLLLTSIRLAMRARRCKMGRENARRASGSSVGRCRRHAQRRTVLCGCFGWKLQCSSSP
eukprot:855114-Pleurochrysis_carterae.AAC.3